jgi:hypothetical protein
MAVEFLDITIVEVDNERSFKRSGKFWDKFFRLSSPVPDEWAKLFDEVWEGAEYSPKRHARIEEGALLTICLLPELQGEHMRFLVRAVERTNVLYRRFLEERTAQQ